MEIILILLKISFLECSFITNCVVPSFLSSFRHLLLYQCPEKRKTIEDLQLSDVNGIILKLEAVDMTGNGQGSIYSKGFTYRLYAWLSKTLPCGPATSCKTQHGVTECHVKPALANTYAG